MVKQSLSLKKCLIILLILFLFYIASEVPFCISKACSRYSLAWIGTPFLSTRFRAKSLTSHRKAGESSSTLSSRLFDLSNSLAICETSVSELREFSSMLPTEL